MAHVQTGGRGRRGKPWVTPAGNLSATLIYRPDASPAEAARRSFLAANALYAALSFYVASEKLSLKWPNDVLLDGHKVAGILLEASGQGSRVTYLSIGIGVNLAHTPQGVENAAFGGHTRGISDHAGRLFCDPGIQTCALRLCAHPARLA